MGNRGTIAKKQSGRGTFFFIFPFTSILESIEVGISLLIRVSLSLEHSKYLHPKQLIDQLKNSGKPRKEVSPLTTVFVSSPNVKS